MKLNIYSLQDLKAKCFNNPFFSGNDATACRSVANLLEDRNNTIALDPADFNLFRVGQFDTESGVIESLSIPYLVSPVVNLRKESV